MRFAPSFFGTLLTGSGIGKSILVIRIDDSEREAASVMPKRLDIRMLAIV